MVSQASHTLSHTEAVLTLFKASIGPGCLSVAYAASQAGLAVAVPGTMLIAGLAVYCMQLLVRVKQELAPQGVQTYGDIGACLAGQIGQRLVESFVVLQQLGICCVYFSFIATNINAFLSEMKVENIFTRSLPLMVFSLYPAIAALAQIRHFKHLTPVATVANVLMVVAVMGALGISTSRLVTAGLASTVPTTPKTNGLFILFGAVVYSFEQVNTTMLFGQILPVENVLVATASMHRVVTTVTTVYVSTLILVGFVPLLAYGYVSSGSLGAELLRLYPTNAVVLALNAMVTVAVLLSYPVQLYAAIRVIEGHVGLLPIEETAADCSHTDEISRTSAPNMLTENGLRDSTDSIEWQGQGSEGPQTSTSRCVADVFLRLVVVLLTALVAAFVDNVGLVIALFGSFAGPILLFILPCLAANQIMGLQALGRLRWVAHWLVVCVACAGLIVSTVATLEEIRRTN